MAYVLGSASAAGAPLRLQNTVNPDGWDSLARAYGTTPQAIIQMQPELRGKAINNKTVQAFIKSRPGWNAAEGLFPFQASNNPGTFDASGKPEGYAHFTNKTQLMLPDMPRLDGKVPSGGKTPTAPGPLKPVFPEEVSGASVDPVMVVGGLALAAILFWPKKKAKKSSPAPVNFG